MKKKYAQISNCRWKVPAMEDVQPSQCFAFSLSPESQPAQYESNKVQKWYAGIVKDLSRIKNADFALKIEVSRLGRLHFHGWIKITTIWKFYLSDIVTLCSIGSFEIDTISDMGEWQRYMDKNEIHMKEMCHAHGIPIELCSKGIKNVVNDSLNYHMKVKGTQKLITEMEYLENVSIDSSDTQTED